MIEDSKYIDFLKKEEKSLKNPESLNRIDNINEFIESLKDFENLEGFLDHVGLVMENMANTSENTISLMTMHASKGLEFDYTFLAGWEEGVFPSQRSLEEFGNKGLEEERRLAYVALTRARKEVNITFVNQNRYSYASHDYNKPSRFINEFPKNIIDFIDSTHIEESSFLDDFIQIGDVKDNYLSPGKKRLIENNVKETIDWDFNQDLENNLENLLNKGQRVFHQKFGYGKVIYIEGDKAKINFEKSDIKTVFLKYLQATH